MLFLHLVYMHGLRQSKQSSNFIYIDLYIQYIGCFSQFLYGETIEQQKLYELK